MGNEQILLPSRRSSGDEYFPLAIIGARIGRNGKRDDRVVFRSGQCRGIPFAFEFYDETVRIALASDDQIGRVVRNVPFRVMPFVQSVFAQVRFVVVTAGKKQSFHEQKKTCCGKIRFFIIVGISWDRRIGVIVFAYPCPIIEYM